MVSIIRMPVQYGCSLSRSVSTIFTPLQISFSYFGWVLIPGMDLGVKTVGLNRIPGKRRAFNQIARESASIQGAPKCIKGVNVPRPSDTLVPSSRQMPGYTVAVCKSGILGEGLIKGRPVSSNHMERCQPLMGMTVSFKVRSVFSQPSSLNRRASSPTVIPWRTGMGNKPTKELKVVSKIFPSTARPLMGLGRSKMTNSFPCSAAASIARAIVQI